MNREELTVWLKALVDVSGKKNAYVLSPRQAEIVADALLPLIGVTAASLACCYCNETRNANTFYNADCCSRGCWECLCSAQAEKLPTREVEL